MYSGVQVALSSYLIRVIKDIVSRNPRFSRALGNVSLTTSNSIRFADLQVIIKDISTDSLRLSPDYFIENQLGRAILAQVADKDGLFIEWLREVDATLQTPVSGVYYFHVDSVDEETREVCLTTEQYKWFESSYGNAQGTGIIFRDGIDATTVTVSDPSQLSLTVETNVFSSSLIYLLTTINELQIKDVNNVILTPNVDYWMWAKQSQVLIASTILGMQAVQVPLQYMSVQLTDQDGYILSSGGDYTFYPNYNADGTFNGGTIQMNPWTPTGATITLSGYVKLDPTVSTNLLNSENTLNFNLTPSESIAPGQVTIRMSTGDSTTLNVSATGTVTLPSPLPPGGWVYYDVRVLAGPQTQIKVKKNAVNQNLLPGLWVAIGDNVFVGDKVAIIIAPTYTETYSVFGSKPNISFTLEIKANDPTTCDEITNMLKQELLIKRRIVMENDGLELYEASTSFNAGQRDDSGTAGTYSMGLSFSGAADWRVYVPLVTRLTGYDITVAPYLNNDFPGKPKIRTRYSSITANGFLPDYK